MRIIRALVLCILLICFLIPDAVLAAGPGDGNLDGGGGSLDAGTGSNSWSPGHDGVRVTVIRDIDNAPVSTPIDYTNITPISDTVHFGLHSKIHYQNEALLIPTVGNYHHKNPALSIPRIISSGGGATNIEAIKQYFCSEYAAQLVADNTGIPYDELTGGDYKLLLEPVAYFRFGGVNMGMTATEAALYDMQLGGSLRAAMGNLTHQNLPLSMFLETSDLGYPAWGGPVSGFFGNDQILAALGLGIVRYHGQPPDAGLPSADFEYLTDTEVVTAVTVSASHRLTPDNPGSVTFHILGGSYTVTGVVIPAGGSQVVWCKWRTPATPQDVPIHITCSGGTASASAITARVVDLNENPPPDPTARDRNDGYLLPSVPAKPQQLSASWSVWYCYWVSDWEWVADDDEDDGGDWVDFGDWEYDRDVYSASLAASVQTMPDEKVPTASGREMKSGYGVNIAVNARVTTNAPGHHTTWAQNAVSYFPEFSYNTYWRLHDRVAGGYNATLELKENIYSTYSRRVHFTPVWFPDADYTTNTWLLDAWTPAGMLSMNLTDFVIIRQSVFDDWHVAPKE